MDIVIGNFISPLRNDPFRVGVHVIDRTVPWRRWYADVGLIFVSKHQSVLRLVPNLSAKRRERPCMSLRLWRWLPGAIFPHQNYDKHWRLLLLSNHIGLCDFPFVIPTTKVPWQKAKVPSAPRSPLWRYIPSTMVSFNFHATTRKNQSFSLGVSALWRDNPKQIWPPQQPRVLECSIVPGESNIPRTHYRCWCDW
jgi:hypothetical protein